MVGTRQINFDTALVFCQEFPQPFEHPVFRLPYGFGGHLLLNPNFFRGAIIDGRAQKGLPSLRLELAVDELQGTVNDKVFVVL